MRSLTCRLTDERNRVLDLNGLHFQFGLLFEFVELLTPQTATLPHATSDSTSLSKRESKPRAKKTQARQQQKRQRRKRALKRGKKKISEAISKAAKTPALVVPQKQSSQ